VQKHWLYLVWWLIWLTPLARGAGPLQEMDFTVDGVARTALVYIPVAATSNAVPLVFVFHGHGGNARQAERSMGIDRVWPEAISVYMQGLKTPGQLTDPQGDRAGWQAALGKQGDRDLKFFDVVLARLKQDYRVDPKRIYATGHSNGGGFTYLLWLTRGDVFAAVAPSSAVAPYGGKLKPKPVMHLAGAMKLVNFRPVNLTRSTFSKRAAAEFASWMIPLASRDIKPTGAAS
jgi:polyhydroxybutyrate depolymerase